MLVGGLPNQVTYARVESVIDKVEYINPPGSTLTLCIVTCKNGYVFTTESGCVDPAKFDPKLGREYAYKKAIDRLWDLEGYLLRSLRTNGHVGFIDTPNYQAPSDATSAVPKTEVVAVSESRIPADDGPLTDDQIVAIRKVAGTEHIPDSAFDSAGLWGEKTISLSDDAGCASDYFNCNKIS